MKDGERIGDLQIRMWKQGAITGTVVDEAGEAIVRIQVRCWRRTSVARASWSACPSVAFTDDRGVYRLSGLTHGDYAIAASSRTASGRRSFVPAMEPAAPGRISGPDSRSRNRLHVYPPTFHPAARTSRDAAIVSIASGEERSGIDLQVHAVPTGLGLACGRKTGSPDAHRGCKPRFMDAQHAAPGPARTHPRLVDGVGNR